MKRFYFRALLLGALIFSTGLRSQGTPADLVGSIITGTQAATTGSDTYLLSQALSGTASTAVDLRSVGGLLVSITGTATSGVQIEWNSTSYTAATWYGSGILPQKTHQFLTKQGKWVRFRTLDSSDPTKKTTLWYTLPDLASLGTVTIAAGSRVDAGGSSVVAYIASGQQMFVTATAAVPSAVSSPAFTAQTYTATSKQLYSFNSSSATVQTVWIHGDFGGAASKWLVTSSGTAPGDLATNGNYLATSATTQVTGPYQAAWWVHVIGIGSAATGGGWQVMQ